MVSRPWPAGQRSSFKLPLSVIGLIAGVAGAIACVVIAGCWIVGALSSSFSHPGKGLSSPDISDREAKESDGPKHYAAVDALALSVSLQATTRSAAWLRLSAGD
jgi:hypothetical protein